MNLIFQIIELNGSSCVLDGLDVKVEPRIWFRLDLPDRKTINIDCKIDSTIGQEIGPILSSYGYKTELVTLCSVSNNTIKTNYNKISYSQFYFRLVKMKL